ncbi:MAG: glycosyltransferase family 25 protein [Oricola sp.]
MRDSRKRNRLAPPGEPAFAEGSPAAADARHWPIFVISLADAQARRARLLDRLSSLGLRYEIVEAVDGRNGLPGQYERFIDRAETPRRLGREMADAEYACALSHHFVYRRVCEEGFAGAIILEDDADPLPGFGDFVLSGGYRGADIVLLDHEDAHVWRFSRRPLSAGIASGRVSLQPVLTTGYSISARGCAYMVANSLPITRPADWPCDITRLATRAAIPRLVGHPPLTDRPSDIAAARDRLLGHWVFPERKGGGLFDLRKHRRSFVKRLSVRIS